METLSDKSLPLALPPYTQLLCTYDPDRWTLWYHLNPTPRSCFTPTLLAEIRDFQKRVGEFLRSSDQAQKIVRYIVLASATPSVFNLGGDINLFAQLISRRDTDSLYDYGRSCADAVYANATGLGCPSLTTITLVQGTALGGGLEAAISSNVLIAEKGAEMGFPEILFNLFPGMGALSLLARKIEPTRAERFISNGHLSTAQALWEQGVVDELAPSGEGVYTVNEFIRRHARSAVGRLAIRQARERINPLSYQELLDIVEIWVEAAMRITSRDLRMMSHLVSAQNRLNSDSDVVTGQHDEPLLRVVSA